MFFRMLVRANGRGRSVRGWLLYDDSCGFCRGAVRLLASTLRARRFAIAPLQAAWVRERLGNPPDLLADVRLLLPDGQVIRGADVYRFLARRIWWAYPLYLLSTIPGLHTLFDRAYRRVATGRHCLPRRRPAPPPGF